MVTSGDSVDSILCTTTSLMICSASPPYLVMDWVDVKAACGVNRLGGIGTVTTV